MHINFDPNTEVLPEVSFSDFIKLDLRIGEVLTVKDFPNAHKPSYQIWLDFGPGVGTKKSSAQITDNYSKEELIGKKLLAVVNFPPRQIANFISEVLILGVADDNDKISLLSADTNIPKGARLL